MDSSTTLVVLLCLSMSQTVVEAVDKHFRGGQIHVDITGSGGGNMTFHVTVMSVWRLDASPCGPKCSFQDIGLSTTSARRDIISRNGDQNLFGNFRWESVSMDASQHLTIQNITSYVNSHGEGMVFDVNEKAGWVQEKLEFNITLNFNQNYEYYDFEMDGLSWPNLRQPCRLQNGLCRYHLQTKVIVGIRNDTSRRNVAPVLSYRPVYQVRLNDVTNIKIHAADPDDDICSCRMAKFIELGDPRVPDGVDITPDCILTVNTSVALGYRDQDFIMIPIVVDQLVKHPVKLDNGYLYNTQDYIGSTTLKLVVQIIEDQVIPEFVPGFLSPCGIADAKHIASYESYIINGQDAVFFLPLMAKPGNGSGTNVEIERFRVMSNPKSSIRLLSLQDMPATKEERIRSSDLTADFHSYDRGTHFVQLVAMDTLGGLSEECTLEINTRSLDYTPQSDENFVGVPEPQDIQCSINTMCDFPVFVTGKSKDIQPSLNVLSSDPALTEVSINNAIQSSIHGVSSTRYQVYVNGTKPGSYHICLKLGLSDFDSEEKCLQVHIIAPDPCTTVSYPCTSSTRGTCHTNVTNPTLFYCECSLGFSGDRCEQDVDVCAQEYCGPNTKRCVFDKIISRNPICICEANFTGDRCESGLNCRQNPCRPHGDCTPSTSSFTCSCHDGYVGELCQQPAGSLILRASTSAVIPVLTESLNLTCQFKRNGQGRSAATVVWLSMFYSRPDKAGQFQEIATVNAESGAVLVSSAADLGALAVSGILSSNNSSSLQLIVNSPSFRDSRFFRCDAEAVDASGALVRSSNVVRVDSGQTPTDVLEREILELRKTRDALMARCKP